MLTTCHELSRAVTECPTGHGCVVAVAGGGSISTLFSYKPRVCDASPLIKKFAQPVQWQYYSGGSRMVPCPNAIKKTHDICLLFRFEGAPALPWYAGALQSWGFGILRRSEANNKSLEDVHLCVCSFKSGCTRGAAKAVERS